MEQLDLKDWKILDMLKQNSRLTSQQISKSTRIPITTVHNRIKKMEKEGIIRQYSIMLDKQKIGQPVSAYILVSVSYSHEHSKKFSQDEVARKIKSIPGTEEVSIVTGGTDMVIRLSVESIDSLNDYIVKKLRNIEGVDKTQSMVILSEYR